MELHTGTIIAICAGFAGLVSCVYYLQSIVKNFKHDKETFKAEILQSAKEAIAASEAGILAERTVLYNKLDSKIESVSKDLDNHKENVEKDLHHMRDVYNGEIRNLGEKIEGLRVELRNQHGQLVNLLSEMIKKSD
jgi:CII-binding regulator of phage lambda lysogenization HflD